MEPNHVEIPRIKELLRTPSLTVEAFQTSGLLVRAVYADTPLPPEVLLQSQSMQTVDLQSGAQPHFCA